MEFNVWDKANNLIGHVKIHPHGNGVMMHVHPPVGDHMSIPFGTAEGAETYARDMVQHWKGWAVVEFTRQHGVGSQPGIRVEELKDE
jgi:hypothetical protein